MSTSINSSFLDNEGDFLSTMLREIANDNDSLELLEGLANDFVEPACPTKKVTHVRLVLDQVKSNHDSRRKVDHSYVDYSNGCATETLDGMKGSKKGIFPTKLMHILSHSELSNIIGWSPHGRAFIVRNASQFEKMVLPRFFKTSQLKSFRKQLSLWGFKRITRGRDSGSYYHQFFLRGRLGLLKMMKYQKIKGVGKASIPNPDDEPNFYNMEQCNPLPEKQPFVPTPVHLPPICLTQVPKQRLTFSRIENFVTEDDNSISTEEIKSIHNQMSFPGPFTQPPEIFVSNS